MLRIQLRTFSSAFVAVDGTAVKPFSALPGPRPLPLVGNMAIMGANVNRFAAFQEECFKKYGEIFKLKLFDYDVVVIKDPQSIEYVLRAEGKYPQREVKMQERYSWLYRNMAKQPPIFALEQGERWRRLRVAAGKQATPRNVHTYSTAFNDICKRFVDYIKATNGSEIDMVLPIKLLFVELAAKFVYGADVRAVAECSEDYREYVNAIDMLMSIFYRLVVELPLYRLYKNKLARDFMAAVEVTNRMAMKERDNFYARLESGKESEAPGLLEQWLREGKMSEEDALNESTSMFTGGVDTTANSTLFLLHALAKHPEVQEKLCAEVKSVLGDSPQVTTQDLSQMPYLKSCILETFRLWSTVPMFSRVLQDDCALLGYSIPKNTNVWYSLHCAGRNEALFPSPLKFDPDRWKRDRIHAFAIKPFGFGPRACYGQRFAELEMKLITVQMIRSFKMSTRKEDLKIVLKTFAKPQEVLIKFEERC